MSIEKLKKLKADYRELVEREGKAILKGVLDQFFTKFPNVDSIRWEQYTPYFNDGDACTFSVNEPYVRLKGTSENCEDGDNEDRYHSYWSIRESNKELSEELELLSNELQELEEVLEHMGDHAQITATRTSIEIDEYEHD
jgi:hypothetical protein